MGPSCWQDTEIWTYFYVTKLDAEGISEWSFENGIPEDDIPYWMALAGDGSVICVGQTYGSWDGDAKGGSDFAALRLDGNGEEIWRYQGSVVEANTASLVKARPARRQRKLDQVEIPDGQVIIFSDELLGKGGFGEVFLAEYNKRNAAAKVLHITHDLGKPGGQDLLEARAGGQSNPEREKSQRKAFLRELEAMTRLRSPHTVGVYRAITLRPDRLVLVMELLASRDLRRLLNDSEQPLPEEQSRSIIGDVCAGMHFLHGKKTVHGDLKSANVLLDGTGRAKIDDFDTSRWSHHTNSTGVATYTKAGLNTQMSLAWSAPEALGPSGST